MRPTRFEAGGVPYGGMSRVAKLPFWSRSKDLDFFFLNHFMMLNFASLAVGEEGIRRFWKSRWLDKAQIRWLINPRYP
jgi:hypothetical protein